MIQEELTIRLPPAVDNGDGTFACRTYPLTVYARQGWRQVQLTGVDIVPNVGIVEVWANDPGGQARRHASQGGTTAIPQVTADELRPLSVTLVNLNTESVVDVVVRFAGYPLFQGSGGAYGIARFAGAYPFGTDGATETALTRADADGSTVVQAEGAAINAFLTTDGPFTERNIRQITGQVRILSPTGTGTIPTSGGSTRVIIVKRDGVTLEAEAATLDLLSTMFDMSVSPVGEVNIDDFADDAIAARHIAPGAINDAGMIADGLITFAKLAAAAVGSGAGKVASGAHTHAHANPFFDVATLGYSYHAVGTSTTTLANFNLGPLVSGVPYFVVAFALAQASVDSTGDIQIYVRIESGGTNKAGMKNGTVAGERPVMAIDHKIVTGAGSSINIAMRANASAAGSFSDGILAAFAFPLSTGQPV